MSAMSKLPSRLGRWVWRSLLLPHHVTETLQRVRAMDRTVRELASALQTKAPDDRAIEAPLQLYRGYTDNDLALLDRFVARPPATASAGFITDFLGVRTRTSFVRGVEGLDGTVLGAPVPDDGWHSEAVEWVGLLKSVSTACDRFACMELGAGWGPWSVAAATAARLIGVTDVHICAVEADPGHFGFMLEHFRDNGLSPKTHHLIEGAVGIEIGRARWPKVQDPAADWGSRPLAAGEVGNMDHIGRQFDEWFDVDVIPITQLLLGKDAWDLVHIDVQGWEVDLCAAAVELLDERVRWLVVGTHDARLHGDLMQLMFSRGWVLENEKPPRFVWASGVPSLIAMTTHDGTQVWRNPKMTRTHETPV